MAQEHIDLEKLNPCIDEQTRGRLHLLEGNAEKPCEVSGLSSALLHAPCKIIFRTPYRYAKTSPLPLLISLNVRKKASTRGFYRYTYSAFFEFYRELPNGTIRKCIPVPTIENLKEVVFLASSIFGTTNSACEKSILSKIELEGLYNPFLLPPSSMNHEDILLPVIRKGENIWFDCSALLSHEKCPPPYRYFPFGALYDKTLLEKLAKLTQEEPCQWKDLGKYGTQFHPYWALGDYLFNLFIRLVDDKLKGYDSLVEYDNKLCFCTGLLGRKSGRYIYGVCSRKDENNRYTVIDWIENDYENGRDFRLPPEAENKNHGLPFPANWTREPEKLICQYEKIGLLEGRIDFSHIFKHHPERLPEAFFIRNQETNTRVVDEQLAKNAIREAIYVARKKIQANYRYAVPAYYRGEISILLPLCLAESAYPNAYLVLRNNRNHTYTSPTLLTPAMAYGLSRVISPQEITSWKDNLFDQMKPV